jgi:hypothetical protein
MPILGKIMVRQPCRENTGEFLQSSANIISIKAALSANVERAALIEIHIANQHFQCYNAFQQRLKGIITLKDDKILSEGILALKEQLKNIPFLDILSEEIGEINLAGSKVDGLLKVRTNQGEHWLAIEAKSNGQPLHARNAINTLLLVRSALTNAIGIFVAPFISTESARICREAGIGYLDLSGNCWLAFQQIYILIENYPNKFSKRRDLVSLYSSKTERILRVLLSDPNRSWKTVDLKESANVSLGMVSYVKSRLAEKEWIRTTPQGFLLSDPRALLSEWEKAYDFNRNREYEFYSIKSTTEFERSLAEVCQQEAVPYALTGFSAANQLAPNVRNQRSVVYVRGDISTIAKRLGLKPVNSGANISILEPYDDGIFWGVTQENGLKVVSPLQAYLDLQHYHGRGEEAAKYLFDEVIDKLWSTSTITAQTK